MPNTTRYKPRNIGFSIRSSSITVYTWYRGCFCYLLLLGFIDSGLRSVSNSLSRFGVFFSRRLSNTSSYRYCRVLFRPRYRSLGWVLGFEDLSKLPKALLDLYFWLILFTWFTSFKLDLPDIFIIINITLILSFSFIFL
jgi:hypothetical protein